MSEPSAHPERRRKLLRAVMEAMSHLLPRNQRGEHTAAVWAFRRAETIMDMVRAGPLRHRLQGRRGEHPWPEVAGAYALGNATAPVAVCCLTSDDLVSPSASMTGVSIAGRLFTPNLGIEKVIRNVTANGSIRFLVVCGKESSIFRPAQALHALMAQGVTQERRIKGAVGHLPVLTNIDRARIETFRRQIELVDCTGETNLAVLAQRAGSLAERSPGHFEEAWNPTTVGPAQSAKAAGDDCGTESFTTIRPGGKLTPLAYDPKGFFVIMVEPDKREIVCRHYRLDNTPAHEPRTFGRDDTAWSVAGRPDQPDESRRLYRRRARQG